MGHQKTIEISGSGAGRMKPCATMQPNPPVNADARDAPSHAEASGARAGYRERYAADDGRP